MLFNWTMQVSRFIEDSGRTSLRLPAVRASDRNMILNLARFYSTTLPTNALSFAAYCTTTLFIKAHSYRPHHSNKYLQLFCVSAYTASLGAQKAHLCCFSLKQDKLLNLSLQFQASHQPGTFPTITLIVILNLIQNVLCVFNFTLYRQLFFG